MVKPSNWVSMLGEYELLKDDTLVFKGGITTLPDQQVSLNIGNFICDQKFGAGTINSTITFEDDTLESAAGIILYYHPATGGFVVVQLGGPALVSVQLSVASSGPRMPHTGQALSSCQEDLTICGHRLLALVSTYSSTAFR